MSEEDDVDSEILRVRGAVSDRFLGNNSSGGGTASSEEEEVTTVHCFRLMW